jgi:quercetin dioxygenase-like cupin family protein
MGRVIDNPVSGERIVIRESGAQTNGQRLSFDLFLPPGGHVPAAHAHLVQEERFTVVGGRIRFRLGVFGRHTIVAGPGETVVVPPRVTHWFGNAGSETAVARVTVRPALRTEELFEAIQVMARAGHLPGTRLPRLADLGPFLLEFQRELAPPNVPSFVIRAVLVVTARLAAARSCARSSWRAR